MYRYNFQGRKEKRQAEAKVRQEASDKLTPQQKLDKLVAAGFRGGKQLDKLIMLITK